LVQPGVASNEVVRRLPAPDRRRRLIDYTQLAKLTASDAAEDDNFGWSVAIDGATVVVGVYRKNSHTGAVYVFRTSDGGATYDEVAKLTTNDATAGDEFGYRLSIDGDTVVVGARYAGIGDYYRRGAVYVFRTTDGGATYDQVAKLTASDAAAYDQFGWSVAIDGDTVVVGAYTDDDASDCTSTWCESGSAYVFRTSDGATYAQVA